MSDEDFQEMFEPPNARRRPHEEVIHGDRRVDDYRWLRDREDPAVVAHLEAENRYTERFMKPQEPVVEALYREMIARIREADSTVPVKVDDHYYYTRTEKGKQYGALCRRTGSLDAPEEVLLDQNELAAGHEFFQLGRVRPSPDHCRLAYAVDLDGSEQYTILVKDLDTGELIDEVARECARHVEWSSGSDELFYLLLDATKRPFRAYRHRLGADVADDVVLHDEPDEAYYATLSRTKSRAFLVLTLKSKVSSEVRILDLRGPAGDFRLVEPRRKDTEYYVAHRDETLFIHTNDGAVNFRVMEAPVASPGKESWKEVVPAADDVTISGIEAFRNHLVLYERRRGLKQIRVLDLRDGRSSLVELPEEVHTFSEDENPEFDASRVRFTYSSFTSPRTVYEYDMEEKSLHLLKRYDVLGGYRPEDYVSRRVGARAPDGTEIPISIVHRRGIRRDGSHPLYLLGYGAYGIPCEPSFRSERISLLERGIIVAIAHVRGGGEMGRRWYEAGKLREKRNTFTDFIAAAEHLIAEGYTSPERVVVSGGSAGGLLLGAVLNARPDLFHAAVADVPFVDVLNTMLDPTLPLTVTEYDEWGNPNERESYECIRSYSPYDNVRAQPYPHLLITAGLNDPRVSYWEPAKWAAKLRALKTGTNVVLLKTNMGAGHRGPSGRYASLRETAFKYAFILDRLGLCGETEGFFTTEDTEKNTESTERREEKHS